MRVGVLALQHESNTFVARPTMLDDFQNDLLVVGEDVRARTAAAHHEIGGFFAGLEGENAARAERRQERLEAVPLFAARATPSGRIREDTWRTLLEQMFAQLEKAMPLDGLLVAAHGAAVSETHPDADGCWLARLRHRVGKTIPIIATLDLHANVSSAMVESCDALIAYRSNPHLDQRQRGIDAASLLANALQGKAEPRMAAVQLPMIVNIDRQMTGEPHLARWYELADRQLRDKRVLSNSIVLGFPYADVEEMGTSVLVVADGSMSLARSLADELAGPLWSHRQDFVGRLVEVDSALEQAVLLEGPVCLLDMGDNVGGGSPADGTSIAWAIHRRGLPRSFVCLYDPESVRRAEQAGTGQQADLRIGGKSDDRHGMPFEGSFHIRSLHDGWFEERQARHGGHTAFDQGRTAIVDTDRGLTVMITSRRIAPFSLEQLRACGLDPAAFKLLVAKGVHAPVAAYREVCRHFIRVNTPGATCADLAQLEFRHRRRPLFPFEPNTQWPVPTTSGEHLG